MRPAFKPTLINDAFSDPGLFIPFCFQKRALLFDLGDLQVLPSKDLLKISHIFVTHTHMDHFIGFDTLLRLFLGRDKELHLFGPPGFFKQVEGKLAGYTWNLVDEFLEHLKLKVTEVWPEKTVSKVYPCRERFIPQAEEVIAPFSGLLLKEPAFYVEGVLLDHRIPCLGLALVEDFSINIHKERLQEMGLPVGPWLTRFKTALYECQDPRSDFVVTWKEAEGLKKEKPFLLGELAEKIAQFSPGQKIVYLTDLIASPENRARAMRLAQDADHLFIEAAFLDSDRDVARQKYHLTAREAGDLARLAGVKHFTTFHYSPRYTHCPEALAAEARQAFQEK
jgi:ribonuclease Z